jgi:hypothetical protein
VIARNMTWVSLVDGVLTLRRRGPLADKQRWRTHLEPAIAVLFAAGGGGLLVPDPGL